MIRPQPVRRPRSWRSRIARWLVGWDRPTTHQTWRY